MLGIQYARNDRGQFGIGSRRGVIRAGIPVSVSVVPVSAVSAVSVLAVSVVPVSAAL